jgi:hypothetical protein
MLIEGTTSSAVRSTFGWVGSSGHSQRPSNGIGSPLGCRLSWGESERSVGGASADQQAVNLVSNDVSGGRGAASVAGKPVNPVSNGAQAPSTETQAGEVEGRSVYPVSTEPSSDVKQHEGDSQPGPGTDAPDVGNSQPQAPQLPAALEAVQLSVGQWLDSALAELDHALPRDDGASPELTRALVDTQRHILAARAALRETRV